MMDNKISVENNKMQGQFEIKKDVMLELLKNIKLDKPQGHTGSVSGY